MDCMGPVSGCELLVIAGIALISILTYAFMSRKL